MRSLDDYLSLLEGGEAPSFEEWLRNQEEDQHQLLRQEWSDYERGLAAFDGFAADTVALRPGSVIEHYTLQTRVGRGGQGAVWQARDEKLERQVALKVLPLLDGEQREHQRLIREAKAVARLEHPGVVQVFGYGGDESLAWIAFELVEGGRTLRTVLDEARSAPSLPEDWYTKVATWIRDIARALDAAHAEGIIHRDIKPGNILMTPAGESRVTDFGLALIEDMSVMSKTGEILGTYAYMSPEQIGGRHHAIDSRTDVFSLGVLFYELLTLRAPFEGDTAHQICAKIVAMDPPDPRRVRSQVPAELAVLCGKALEKRVGDRFATMAEFAEEVENYLAHRPIRTSPPGYVERARKWSQRNPLKAVLLGTVSVALVVVSALSLTLFEQNKDLQKANAELLVKALLTESELVSEAASEIWPPVPEMIPAMERWVQRARKFGDEARDAARLQSHVLEATEQDVKEQAQLLQEAEALFEDGGLASDGVRPDTGWGVLRRLATARRIEKGLESGGRWRERWEHALGKIQANGRLGLEDLAIQPGLVPLGVNPNSGLWEFWHVASGEEPERNEVDDFEMSPAAGLVFVLIPGGVFSMGAIEAEFHDTQNYDPFAQETVRRVHEVKLAPFFISKYEMSREQWVRLCGSDVSSYKGEDYARCPVESVKVGQALELMRCFGLDLPTEAQWEYAARAGSHHPWWFGDDPNKLLLSANVADASLQRAARSDPTAVYAGWSDGYHVVAPIDAFGGPHENWPGHPYGLYGVNGNVREWCRDRAGLPELDPYSYPTEEGTGLRLFPEGKEGELFVARGGSWKLKPSWSTSSRRDPRRAESTGSHYGLRPVFPRQR